MPRQCISVYKYFYVRHSYSTFYSGLIKYIKDNSYGELCKVFIPKRCRDFLVRLTPGVSCAAGRRGERGGRRHEVGARQCACGRPLERQKCWVAADGWRLGGSVLGEAGVDCRVNRAQPRDAPAASAAQPGWGARARPLARPRAGRERRGKLIPAGPALRASAGRRAAGRTIRHATGDPSGRRRTPPRRRHAHGHKLRGDSGRWAIHEVARAEVLPNAGRQRRRWRACEGWRTVERGSCQAMRVRPTYRTWGTLDRQKRLKVGGCRGASRPERFAG